MDMKNMKVVIMGLGYIGLPTAALVASKGIKVHGVDIDERVINTINKGSVHIIEPDLEGLVHKVVEAGLLRAFKKPAEADIFIIAVPTPLEKHSPDISYVETAVEMIIPYLNNDNLVIIESTIPVGVTRRLYNYIHEKRPDIDFYMAYCPERVLPGKILYELEHNSRIIGGINSESADRAEKFYKIFVKGELYKTDTETAELCKLVENAYRDVNIAFANEISLICDRLGVDVWNLIELANKHPRVNILRPGVGVGGHCIAVDPWFIISEFPQFSRLMKTAREVNLYKTKWVLEKIKEKINIFESKFNRKPKVACLGLSYKPDVDDLRESPALHIVRELIREGFNILPVEPHLSKFEEFNLFDYESAIKEADIIAVLVCHSVFKNVFQIADSKEILDFCGIKNSIGRS